MVLRSVGVLSAGKVMGVTYALLGLIVGGLFTLIAIAGLAGNANQPGQHALPFMAMGAGAIIFFPIVYGIFGFVGGIIGAALYNMVAGFVGGIEMDFQRRADFVSAP